MGYTHTLRHLIERSGYSLRGASQALGHSPTWAGATLADGHTPLVSTLVDVASLCGCRVLVVDKTTGETVADLAEGQEGTG